MPKLITINLKIKRRAFSGIHKLLCVTKINSKSKPSGSKSQKNDNVYIYQTDIGIWAKGKIKSGSENDSNFYKKVRAKIYKSID